MKKGQRPSRHYRLVKTKHGRKKVLINRSIIGKQNRDKGLRFEHRILGKLKKQYPNTTFRSSGSHSFIDVLVREPDKYRIIVARTSGQLSSKEKEQLEIFDKPYEQVEVWSKPSMKTIKKEYFKKARRKNYGSLFFPNKGKLKDDVKDDMDHSIVAEINMFKEAGVDATNMDVKETSQLLNKQLDKRNIPKVLYHGTSEKALVKMPTSEGLKASNGKLYLTDNPNYARLRAREAVEGTKFDPVVIAVDKPKYIEREGRHFITEDSIKVKDFKKVYIGKDINDLIRYK
jgi:hypothetical protein